MNSHNTEQAARGYLMYQLAKRGYTVQFTDSRFPLEDMLCVSPTGVHFGIDVKGQRTPSFWRYKKPTNLEVYYVFTYVPPLEDLPRVFIVPFEEALTMWMEYYAEVMGRSPKREDYPWGINWTTPFFYEDRYDLLPK